MALPANFDFGDVDKLVVAMAKGKAQKPNFKYFVEWRIDGAPENPVDYFEPSTYVVRSLEDGLAYLLGFCEDSGVYPEKVEASPDHDELTFKFPLFFAETFRASSVAVLVAPIQYEPPASPTWRRRAKSTILGLVKYWSAGGELSKRVAKWPGLSITTFLPFYSRDPHWPCPSDWLAQTKLFGEAAGDASLNYQNDIAHALGFKSWHHLCGSVSGGDDAWLELSGPYLFCVTPLGDSSGASYLTYVYGYFHNPLDAAIALFRWAKDAFEGAYEMDVFYGEPRDLPAPPVISMQGSSLASPYPFHGVIQRAVEPALKASCHASVLAAGNIPSALVLFKAEVSELVLPLSRRLDYPIPTNIPAHRLK